MENKENSLNLEIKPEIAKGTYSNLAIITHSHSEFVLDFATVLPGFPKPEIGSRVVMHPEHAKRLLGALIDNINKYEAQFGPIEIPGQSQPKDTFHITDLNPGGAKS